MARETAIAPAPGGPPPHVREAREVARELRTDDHDGLTEAEAARRLDEVGPNELPRPKGTPLVRQVLRQLVEPMALLLLVAAAVSWFALDERVEGLAIVAIVVLNAAIGLVEERRAEAALESLRGMETPMARVRRGGRVVALPSRDVVPGDLVVLQPGDRVPADVRLTRTTGFEADESTLTGESLPAAKQREPVADPDAALGDRRSIAFGGTLAVRGTAEGIVVATGPASVLGGIAESLAEAKPTTPLQRELARLTAILGGAAVVIAAGVFLLELARAGDGIERAFLGAVALAVAAVPEGLATVVTVALALGVRRMAVAGAIVRRLPAVETLGSTTVILTDKTGTLTQNRMVVTSAALHGGVASLDELSEPIREAAREVAALCNDAELDPPSGDPLDVALLEAVGPERVAGLRLRSPRLAEVPFDSARKRMTVVVERDGSPALLVKGAPELVLRASSSIVEADGGTRPLDEERRAELIRAADAMAGEGMRTIALARRVLVDAAAILDPDAAVGELTAIAVVGMRDPLRPEAPATVEQARAAGVRVVMVTGDHPGTASAIARDVGLAPAGHRTMTGAELRRDGVPDDPLSVGVYARVDPDQKLDLVEALQGRGDVVAVTGDGVNDAPALRRADIGVAMGMGGSDVAREASDMIVTDDNLATVVRAIREGRAIYDNVRKVVDYLIAGNLSEITVVVGSLLLFVELGVPLEPLQLLWINLLTDGLPAIALGVDDPAPDLMGRAPRAPGERLLSGRRLGRLAIRGVLLASGAIAALAIARYGLDRPWEEARTVLFTTLVVAHLLYAYVARLPSRGLLTNGWLLAATLAGLGLQALLVAWRPAGRVFATTPMPAELWLLVAVAALVPVVLLGLIVRARVA